ncbi:LTA synthase family protein [Enterococcus sp. LJL98]
MRRMLTWFILLLYFTKKILPRRRKIYFFLFPYLAIVMGTFSLILLREFNDEALSPLVYLFPTAGRNLLNHLLMLFVGVLISFVLQGVLQLEKKGRLIRREGLTKKQISWMTFSGVLVFLGSLLVSSSLWAVRSFGNLTFDQMVYTLSQPLGDSDPGQVMNFLVHPFLNAMGLTLFILNFFLLFGLYHFSLKKQKKSLLVPVVFGSSLLLLIGSASISILEIGYADIKAYYFEETELYERYYVDPRQVSLTFPEKKRNLIYLYLESMESSYASKEVGGIKEQNLIPNLTDLAFDEGIQFSHQEGFGGFYQVPGANQTASAMVAQTSGLPLRASGGNLDANFYGQDGSEFFPGAYSLGEVLETAGYNQMLFIGSSQYFAGRGKYFSQHGNYEIRDVYWARDQGLIPEDYWEWWGYEDRKLFEFAKASLTELASKGEPFNFTMLTTDTHFEDGYLTEETPDRFGDQYSNVIYDNDRQVKAFLDWIKQQPFYEETTVVLVGDHLTMDRDFFETDDPEYQRTVYNVFLNTEMTPKSRYNRQATALDLFPTTLAALGVTIQGERLALGTNLFSKAETLAERLGVSNFYTELTKRSDFYAEHLMQGTDEEVLKKREAQEQQESQEN